jgi:hypothetical protein
MVSIKHVLDIVYLVVILGVAVGGALGVWWLNREEGESDGRLGDRRGLLVAVAASLFVLGLVAQFLWHVFDVSGLFGI